VLEAPTWSKPSRPSPWTRSSKCFAQWMPGTASRLQPLAPQHPLVPARGVQAAMTRRLPLPPLTQWGKLLPLKTTLSQLCPLRGPKLHSLHPGLCLSEVAQAANRGQKSPEVKTPPARATAAPANNPTKAKAQTPPANTPATAPPASTTPARKAVPKDPSVANPATPASAKAPPPQIVFDDPVPADPAPPQPTPEPATQPGAPERAPALASEAPPFRVGHTVNDSEGRPLLCLVQLWACRKICEQCGNGFCQATFSDRTASFHPRHRCRDCKRAEGRSAQQTPAYSTETWEHGGWQEQPAWSWEEQWGGSWNEGWNEGQWR